MKSLERRFNNISRLNPKWSSYICFAEALKKQNFNRKTIYYWFNRLVEKNDYDKADKYELVKCLISLSANPKKMPEEDTFDH